VRGFLGLGHATETRVSSSWHSARCAGCTRSSAAIVRTIAARGGLSEEEGHAHPTRGGLRIGKPLAERSPDEPIDERREWDRNGQYFHYLTKWMHALDQVARSTGQPMFNAGLASWRS
jgi:hypothetical protein